MKAYLGNSLRLLFLTADDTHDEATLLVGNNDSAFCVMRRAGKGNFAQTLQVATQLKRMVRNLLQQHGVDLLYCPFGTVSSQSDRIPTVAMIVDTLYRDFPFSLRGELVALGKERLNAFDFSMEVARLADLFADAAARRIPVPKRKRNRLKHFWLAGTYYARAFARKTLHAAVEVPLRLEQWSTLIL